ncbi:MAG: hypothetical protein JW791_05140 [Nanoarchaeota archaeon]|nr:hypothetical protein [Nanoarchaeota archaeon]
MKKLSKILKTFEYIKKNTEELKEDVSKNCPMEGGMEYCNTLETRCINQPVCYLIKKYETLDFNEIQPEEVSELIRIMLKLDNPVNREKADKYINENYCPYNDDVECDPVGIRNDTAKTCTIAPVCEILCSGHLLTDEEREEKLKETEFDEKYQAMLQIAESIKQDKEIAEKNSRRDISNLFL